MFKRDMFSKQQLKFMLLNLIAFTLIFTVFSFIIFGQVQRTLYKKADEELLSFKERILDGNNFPRPNGEYNDDMHPPMNQRKNGLNPRAIIVHWNKEGEIINQEEIGTSFYENYLVDYQPEFTNMDTITQTTIQDQYHFRYILFKNTHDHEEGEYTQLMVSVDAEQTIMNNFVKLIVLCSTIFIVLSISASYFLSKKMMKPIILSWHKQSEFVENASHELRTPLTIIQNKLELLLTTPQEKIATKFENIAVSLSETRRLSKLTSDLLTLARADSAETKLDKGPIQVDEFVRNVCQPYQEVAELQEKYFWLNLKCPRTIQGDDTRLHQLLVILLDNALKYTNENDSIGIKTYEEESKIVMEVTDTGMGIKEENIPHVFDRFYREDRARTRESGGTGLGLSIAKWIVTEHNGTIKVSSHPNNGTTFKIKLPK